jgi:hypothetical protein
MVAIPCSQTGVDKNNPTVGESIGLQRTARVTPLGPVTFELVQTTKEAKGDMWRVADRETAINHQRR